MAIALGYRVAAVQPSATRCILSTTGADRSATIRILLVVPIGLALAAAGPGHRYTIDSASSDVAARVAFFAVGSKTAHFPKMSGGITLDPASPGNADLSVTLDARALTAPDKTTLARLKGPKFFWVERYPTVRFVGHGLRLSGNRGSIGGQITARGVTRPATLAVTFAQPVTTAGPITLTGRTTIDRKAFGMTAYSGVVGRKVSITIRARMMPA